MEIRFLWVASFMLFIAACNSKADKASEKKSEADSTRASTTAPDGATSQNSLDWSGFYAGNLPCADCEGIKTTVRLKKNNTYTGSSIYLGKNATPLVSNGTFEWTDNGSSVILSGNAGGKREYRVVEGGLILKSSQGKKMEGAERNKYILTKANAETPIENKRWVLTSLNGEDIAYNPNEPSAHFILNSLENRASGSLGCNRFFGNYTVAKGDSLSFSKLGTTMMACADMRIEDQMKKILERVSSYALLNDTTLRFDAGKERGIAVFTWLD